MFPITPDGHRKLQDKLKHLRKVERPKIIQAIELAREHGDLSENAEYDAAKERQALITREIAEAERTLASAKVINPAEIRQSEIVFGARVVLLDSETGGKKGYQIVGAFEADASDGKISIESPLARALIGKAAGATVFVQTPGGRKEYEILEVTYS